MNGFCKSKRCSSDLNPRSVLHGAVPVMTHVQRHFYCVYCSPLTLHNNFNNLLHIIVSVKLEQNILKPYNFNVFLLCLEPHCYVYEIKLFSLISKCFYSLRTPNLIIQQTTRTFLKWLRGQNERFSFRSI